MKAFATVGAAVLFLSLGTLAPAFAQHEQEEAKPEEKQQQEHAQQRRSQKTQNSSSRSMPSSRTRTSSSNNSRLGSRESSSRPTTPKNSSMPSRSHGRGIDQKTGSQTTARGSNAAGTTGIAFLTTVSADTLAQTTGSSFTGNPIWWLAGSRASSTAAIGSALSIRGQGTGRTTGTRPTTFMWSTLTMDITCTTAGILPSALRSTSPYKGSIQQGVGEIAL